MNWTTEAIQRQLAPILALPDQLLARESELDQREAAIAAAAEAPWESMAVQQAEQVGAETRTLQILALLEQQLDWLESNSPPAIVLGTLREQILNLESL
jgi:hypothetical protein